MGHCSKVIWSVQRRLLQVSLTVMKATSSRPPKALDLYIFIQKKTYVGVFFQGRVMVILSWIAYTESKN